jgi:hypothetical protein
MPLAAIKIVAARTSQEPHAICGAKSKTSIKNAKREAINVKILSMNIPKRYRGEWDGEWKWAVAPRMSIMSVNNAAIGWTMRIAERVVLAPDVLVGKSKLADCASSNKLTAIHIALASYNHCSGI